MAQVTRTAVDPPGWSNRVMDTILFKFFFVTLPNYYWQPRFLMKRYQVFSEVNFGISLGFRWINGVKDIFGRSLTGKIFHPNSYAMKETVEENVGGTPWITDEAAVAAVEELKGYLMVKGESGFLGVLSAFFDELQPEISIRKENLRLMDQVDCVPKLKNALKQLQDDYLKSKDSNPIMRIIHLLEETSSVPPSGGISALLSSTMMGRSVETRVDQSLYDSIKSRKTEELQKDCENMYAQLYKLIKKYQGLRRIIKELHDKYDASRMYPIVPRYPILKKMIKSALRAPEFADICHEQTE
ncbi:hypothetical protein NECAME_09537 [Necator americanus]|uniref:Uncharacterized protein n=1 Tax=Necator americanus TaxID=51031 RepID=W2TFU8_NECAM|nr:hypothetical protein NECAME_09537 [Necator americanus]ETN79882.1 hypothetical protein NECAME_09537 [Necator americanus]